MANRLSQKLLEKITALALQESLVGLYAFGSRAVALPHAPQRDELPPASNSDLDIAVVPAAGTKLTVLDKVRIAQELEELFDIPRVDLVVLPEADPFLAANIIRGERLYTSDPHAADEYELYILRRAGDLAPLERERQALILGESQ